MFNKLRNKFILINLGFTTAAIIIAFTSIYFIAEKNFTSHQPIPDDAPKYKTDVSNIIVERVEKDRQKNLKNLSEVLIIAGIGFEMIVAIISYLLAEQAISPIKNAYEMKKQFIANASHELKTPIAAIQANLEASEIANNHWINNVKYEAEKLAQLNSNLLELSRRDAMQKTEKTQEENIKKIIERNLQVLSPKLNSKKVIKHYEIEKKDVNKKDFEELFNIILDNAIKYSNKTIIIELTEKYLAIQNDGQGINENEKEKIFERFYQKDKNSEGIGLGLSIAKAICNQYHWKINAESKNNMTTIKILF